MHLVPIGKIPERGRLPRQAPDDMAIVDRIDVAVGLAGIRAHTGDGQDRAAAQEALQAVVKEMT